MGHSQSNTHALAHVLPAPITATWQDKCPCEHYGAHVKEPPSPESFNTQTQSLTIYFAFTKLWGIYNYCASWHLPNHCMITSRDYQFSHQISFPKSAWFKQKQAFGKLKNIPFLHIIALKFLSPPNIPDMNKIKSWNCQLLEKALLIYEVLL